MIKALINALKKGVVTVDLPTLLPSAGSGFPKIVAECTLDECNKCVEVCPTNAINYTQSDSSVQIDLGSCINCSLCIQECPAQFIVDDKSFETARSTRSSLIVSAGQRNAFVEPYKAEKGTSAFKKSIACRVVSTGCSACDLELAACNNPVFDMERFGITVVASPRFADVLLVTGPVPKSMHTALKICYESMPLPRKVVAVGTCAISGGVHKGGYAEANGVPDCVPVDMFVPGCPPHPVSIITALKKVMSDKWS